MNFTSARICLLCLKVEISQLAGLPLNREEQGQDPLNPASKTVVWMRIWNWRKQDFSSQELFRQANQHITFELR